MKLEVWLDSGANIHSKRTTTVDTEDLGFTDFEWNELSEDAKYEIIKDVAFEHADWGFKEIE